MFFHSVVARVHVSKPEGIAVVHDSLSGRKKAALVTFQKQQCCGIYDKSF